MPVSTAASAPTVAPSATAPGPSPSPAAAPAAIPPAVATPAPAVRPAEPFNWQLWLFGGGALALLALLWVRYQRDAPSKPARGEPDLEPAAAEGAPRSVYRTSGPWLTVSLRPVRAGLNMITAVADCEITVTNRGGAPAEAIRTALTLLAAHARQQSEIAAANAQPISRPVVPAFTLAPGEARTFRGVASAPLDILPTMRAGDRNMLVPLVLLNIQHRDPEGVEHRTSQGFVVGVERVDSSKLAPFWVDSIRMIDQVAARPSGAPDRRRLEPA